MTFKAAAARLDLGGGKGVICAPAEGRSTGERRRAALLDFADLVESLDGRYITAEDVGVCPDDMVTIARAHRPRHRPAARPRRLGRPEPVHRARRRGGDARLLRAGLRRARSRGPAGRRDRPRPRRLRASPGGSRPRARELIVSDIVADRSALADELGARVGRARRRRCSASATCSRPARSAARSTARTSTRCAAGSSAARPTTSSPRRGSPPSSRRRGILYAPDFIANAGGLIHVYMEIKGYSEEHARRARPRHRGDAGGRLRRSGRSARSPRSTPHASSLANGSTPPSRSSG